LQTLFLKVKTLNKGFVRFALSSDQTDHWQGYVFSENLLNLKDVKELKKRLKKRLLTV